MNIKVKLIDESLPMLAYQTEGAAGFDLYSRIDITIEPLKPTLVPTNMVVKTPKGYFLMVAARSSLPLKKNLMLANGIGVVDEDYCGDEDEIKLQLLNFSQSPVEIKKGERIGQAVFVKIEHASSFQQVTSMKTRSRGGFGSTGA